MVEWSTACPDWAARLRAGETIIPPPIFPEQAEQALAIFKELKIVDAPGSPTFGESCAEWVFDLVRCIFGAYDAESGRRLIVEFFVLIPKKNSKSTSSTGFRPAVTHFSRRQHKNGLERPCTNRDRDTMLTSCSVSENDYPAWASGTTYAQNAFCISPVTHRVYQSLVANNSGRDPTDVNNQSGATPYWEDYGPTNQWAMFDGEANTQTVAASPLTVVLHARVVTDMYLAGVVADTVTVTVRDAPGGNTIFTQAYSMEASAPADYYEYFFDPFKPLTDLLVRSVDPYGNGEVTVVLSSSSGTVKCGLLAVGSVSALGDTQYGAKAKPKSYSSIKTDKFGRTSIVRRKATTDLSATAMLKLEDANDVLATIQGLLDVPAVWIGSDLPEHTGLRCFGLGSGELSYDFPVDCQLSLTVQGLI